jgi:biopolymer transport protein ExbD
MTAMCDVAFLLLTFFMLTTKFKADDPVVVDLPSSISEIKLPDADIMTIAFNKDGQVIFGVDGKFNRRRLIEYINERQLKVIDPNLALSEEEMDMFSLVSSFGVPLRGLKRFLDDYKDSSPEEMKNHPLNKGIPIDSTNNELRYWIMYGRMSNPKFRIAVRGDRSVPYPVVKKVIDALQERNVNKFNLITNLENRPKPEELKVGG